MNMNSITPLIGPLADMLKSKKSIVLVVALTIVGVLCYLGKIDSAAMLDFDKWLIGAFMVAEGVAKIGSPSSGDTPVPAAKLDPEATPKD
jgi:uncharacterized membrane protein HdeD (DUF308 family)